MSQDVEKETITVAEATIEAGTSNKVATAEAVETSTESGGVSSVEDAEATSEPEPVEDTETPVSQADEPVSEGEMAQTAEASASADTEEASEARSEVEETVEEPQAPASDTEEEATAPEAIVAEQQPEKAPEPKTPLSDLKIGTEMAGRVVGIADFGAFVDIGAETDGLIHISELSDGRVNKVTDVVSVGQQVNIWIKDVDTDQERISLSMRPKPRFRLRDLKPGMVVEGTVTGIRDYGVFVDIGSETEGLVHVSEMAEGYVNKPSELVSTGDDVEVRIKKVDRKRRRISLSMKGLGPSVRAPEPASEEPTLTSMEFAMRRALGALEEEIEEESDEHIGAEEASRDELGDVFARMLREYRTDTENA